MHFVINCIPPKKTHQSSLRIFKPKGLNHTIVARDKKGQQTQNELMWLLIPYKPEKPLEGALKLSVKWVYPYRASEPKKNRVGDIPCIARPDCDNLAKGLNDCMTRLGFWLDDSQVYELKFTKLYGSNPRIEIELEEV